MNVVIMSRPQCAQFRAKKFDRAQEPRRGLQAMRESLATPLSRSAAATTALIRVTCGPDDRHNSTCCSEQGVFLLRHMRRLGRDSHSTQP
jgi:hypothetical protein